MLVLQLSASPLLGICTLHHYGYKLVIERADPVISIHAYHVNQLRPGTEQPGPDAEPWSSRLWGLPPEISLDGDLLRMEGFNWTVIYRVGEKIHDSSAYRCEWPD